ncbi:MAG: hypothetical protein ACI4LO_01985 [Anaerovoracaceae bacterium]
MSLTAERNTIMVSNRADVIYLPVGKGKKIYKGSIVVLKSGYAEPGSKAEGLIAAGRAEETVDNSNGAAGDVFINVRRGTFIFENDESAAVTNAELLQSCYILDDCTVTATSTGASVAGKVIEVTSEGVAVEIW